MTRERIAENEIDRLLRVEGELRAEVARLRAVKAKMICEGCRRLAEVADENERLRAALELIAGSTTDKLQAMQARCELDNIGPELES